MTVNTTPPIHIDCVVLSVESYNPSISSDFAAHRTSSEWTLCKQPGDKTWETMIARLLDDTQVNGKVTLRKYLSLEQEHNKTKSKNILKQLQAIRRITHPKEEKEYRAGQSRISASSMTLRGKDATYRIDFDLQYSGRLVRKLRERTIQDGKYEDQTRTLPGPHPARPEDIESVKHQVRRMAKFCNRTHKETGTLLILFLVIDSRAERVRLRGPDELSATKTCMTKMIRTSHYKSDFQIKEYWINTSINFE